MTKPEKNDATIQKLSEAQEILSAIGFSGKQCNKAAAYTLLALCGLRPSDNWQQCSAPLMGITPIINFIHATYGKLYEPNSREQIRDDAVKYFVGAGFAVRNPDDLARPTNSDKTVYQLEANALKLLRFFGTKHWKEHLSAYLISLGQIRRELERARQLNRIPIVLPTGDSLTLSPGGQNRLIKLVVEEFAARFLPQGILLYLGDAENKFDKAQKNYLGKLGINIPAPAKMPDVIIHDPKRNWLVLIEAVTTAGPVDGKRRKELKDLFAGCTCGLVFVSTFEDRATLRKFLKDISWETEVWVAENPDHLIHFNGERFLGPYPDAMPT